MRRYQRPPRHYGREMLAIRCGCVHILDCVNLAAFLAKLPEQILGSGLAYQRFLHAVHPYRDD
jgi:hypothetical protein